MDTRDRTDWPLVALLWCAGLLAAGQFAKVSLTFDWAQVVWPQAGAGIGFAVSILSTVGIVFGATAGAIVARFGVRRVLLAALCLAAAMSAVQALILPFALFLLTRVAEGFAHLAIVVAAPTLMAQISAPRHTPVVMGLWGMFFGVGFAIAGALMPLAGNLVQVFLFHATGLIIVAALLAPRLPSGHVRVRAEAGGWIAAHRRTYTEACLFAPALVFLWHTLTFVAVLTFLPGYLGWPGAAALLPVLSMIGTFGAGALARWLPPLTIALVAFSTTVPLALLLIAVPEALRLLAALPLMLSLGVIPGASFAAIPALNAEAADRARANGAIAQLGNVGTFGGTPLFALALSIGGFAAIGLLTAAFAAAGIVTVLWNHARVAQG